MTSNIFDTILRQDFAPTSDDDWRELDGLAQHFFGPTAPIDEDRLFAGRIKQLSDLLDVIYQAGAHAGKPKRFMYSFHNPLLEPLVVMRGAVNTSGPINPSLPLFPNE